MELNHELHKDDFIKITKPLCNPMILHYLCPSQLKRNLIFQDSAFLNLSSMYESACINMQRMSLFSKQQTSCKNAL